MQKNFFLTAALAATVLLCVGVGDTLAVMTGPCSGCHTMHNSQDNKPMRFDTQSQPLPQLLRGDCYGCHAQGSSEALVSVGIDVIPQVYHTHATDLAGGNFAYITGAKGGVAGANDNKGHNIADLWTMGPDENLEGPPGGISQFGHNGVIGNIVTTDELKCAGTNGCHGNRWYVDILGNPIDGYEGITGAHHNNRNGAVTQDPVTDREPGHGYRFLLGVNGYEDPDWQFTKSPSEHNEYFGRTSPIKLACWVAGTSACHGFGGVRPPSGTMAEYCGTCHGNFHTLTVGTGDDSDNNSSGVGSGASPFIRHPSDLALPTTGEYTAYTSYLTITPVARTTVPIPVASSDTITQGSDAVFCLSCHVAHASPYPDMLKWDYSTMQVGNGGAAAGTGCFACHSSKD